MIFAGNNLPVRNLRATAGLGLECAGVAAAVVVVLASCFACKFVLLSGLRNTYIRKRVCAHREDERANKKERENARTHEGQSKERERKSRAVNARADYPLDPCKRPSSIRVVAPQLNFLSRSLPADVLYWSLFNYCQLSAPTSRTRARIMLFRYTSCCWSDEFLLASLNTQHTVQRPSAEGRKEDRKERI